MASVEPTPTDQHPPSRLLAAVDAAVRWVAYLGSGVLAALMVLTVVDVTLRYFGRPIFGAQDYTQLFLLIVVAFSIAFSGRACGHVAVDLLSMFVKRDVTRWTDIAVKLVAASMIAVIAWQTFDAGLKAADYGLVSNVLQLPFLPYLMTISFGLTLYAVVLVLEAWLLLLRGAAPQAEEK